MINQFRTLLLNQPVTTIQPPAYPGEEYVPPEYIPKMLTGDLNTVRQMIFGINPDRAMLNLRLRQLLGIIHSSELSEFVYALDPRVTYWPSVSNDLFSTLSGGPTITTLLGTTHIYVVGATPPFVDSEQLYYGYTVTVTDGSHVQITPLLTTNPPTIATYSLTAGLSNVIPFPGANLSFRFQAGVGAEWQVFWLAYPAKSLLDVYRDLKDGLTVDLETALFGANPTEPMQTFKNLWRENPYPPYQLAAVTLALGYQTNALTV